MQPSVKYSKNGCDQAKHMWPAGSTINGFLMIFNIDFSWNHFLAIIVSVCKDRN